MPAIAIGVWFCAYLVCAGWALSALHQLNVAGCAIVLAFWVGAFLVWCKRNSAQFLPPARWKKILRRFRGPFPAIFLLAAILTFLGGVLHAPTNYDALTYRLPRILNWLAAGHWLWIPTLNERMNYSTTGWEWIALPFLGVFRSDRGLFLINIVGILLMPGLLFSVFRQLGVAGRVARMWMWILPMAYGYAMQAGGIGNDFLGAVFCLASIHFGLRARRSGAVSDIWLCGLAAALMTNVKLSNLPLLLPCLVAVWPALKWLSRRWLAGIPVVVIAILISAAPTMVLNQVNTGSWNGDPKNAAHLQVKNPAAGLLGNSLLVLKQAFMPPILPDAHKVDARLDNKLPKSWRHFLDDNFPRFRTGILNELPQEESAGLGLGVTLLLLAALGTAVFGSFRRGLAEILPSIPLVVWAAWVAAFVFMIKMASEADARLMLAYYGLVIIPVLLLPAQERLERLRAWKILAVIAALSVVPAIVLSPARPLWPALSVSEFLVRQHPDSPGIKRLASVYATYANRNDLLAPLRDALPGDVRKIGFLASDDDSDYSLWRPFGMRRVEYLELGDRKSIVVPDDVEWIVVNKNVWSWFSDMPLEDWAAEHHGQIVLSVPIVTFVSWGGETWCLLQIQKP